MNEMEEMGWAGLGSGLAVVSGTTRKIFTARDTLRIRNRSVLHFLLFLHFNIHEIFFNLTTTTTRDSSN